MLTSQLPAQVGGIYNILSESEHQVSMKLKLGEMWNKNGTYMEVCCLSLSPPICALSNPMRLHADPTPCLCSVFAVDGHPAACFHVIPATLNSGCPVHTAVCFLTPAAAAVAENRESASGIATTKSSSS